MKILSEANSKRVGPLTRPTRYVSKEEVKHSKGGRS